MFNPLQRLRVCLFCFCTVHSFSAPPSPTEAQEAVSMAGKPVRRASLEGPWTKSLEESCVGLVATAEKEQKAKSRTKKKLARRPSYEGPWTSSLEKSSARMTPVGAKKAVNEETKDEENDVPMKDVQNKTESSGKPLSPLFFSFSLPSTKFWPTFFHSSFSLFLY